MHSEKLFIFTRGYNIHLDFYFKMIHLAPGFSTGVCRSLGVF
uniref:Uncharacterized protein n=1 Tax=Anguilla anguilla TaxID=7936 RepID=A0A0E9TGE0_ANGAN